mgnify:CR=1 FL=1
MPLFGWALVLMVASYTIQSFLIKKQNPQAVGIEDIDFPQAEEGTHHAVFFGDNWTTGYQVLWYGNMRTKKIKSGGKK